jgi:vibriolysin
MSRNVVRGALFFALTGAGACAISDTGSDKVSGPAEMEEVRVFVDESITSKGDMAASAAAYLANNLLAVNAAAGDNFAVENTGIGVEGQPYLRMGQTFKGVPVFGAGVVVGTNESKFSSARGNVLKGLEGFDITPSISKDAAMSAAKNLYLGKVTNRIAAIAYDRESNQLVIVPGEKGAAPRLAFYVKFNTELQGGVDPMQLNAFVDAHTGEIIKSWNGIHSLSQASGPGGNAKVARTWNAQLDVEPSGTQFQMDTARLRTTNMRNGTTGQGTIVVGPLNPIGDAAINDAHGFSEAVFNMLVDWQGENSINGAGFKLISRVHYSTAYENAFWDGAQMTYGDGASTFYPLSGSADVAGHEINHGYTSFHSNLTYSAQSGGLNESFSDIAGEVTEAYIKQAAPDMLVGADIFKSATGALRYMCNPTMDGRSIDNLANYANQDVHLTSGISNKAFCRTVARFATGSPTGAPTMAATLRASRAWYVANKQIWTAGTTFVQGCQGTVDAATLLGFTATEIAALKASWADVGVVCGGGGGGGTGTISSLTLSANISHTWRGDLVVTLTSPTGTSFVVSNRAGGSADNIILTNSAIAAFNGAVGAGTWTLKVQDLAAADIGTLNSWSVTVNRVGCTASTVNSPNVPKAIPDNNATGITSTLSVAACP